MGRLMSWRCVAASLVPYSPALFAFQTAGIEGFTLVEACSTWELANREVGIHLSFPSRCTYIYECKVPRPLSARRPRSTDINTLDRINLLKHPGLHYLSDVNPSDRALPTHNPLIDRLGHEQQCFDF